MQAHKIAIVGGGATGTSLLTQLAPALVEAGLSERVSVSVFEKSGRPGPGLAYGTELDCHLLNTPAEKMGVLAGRPLDFVRWLRARGGGPEAHGPARSSRGPFPPRRLFGHYLEDIATSTLRFAWANGLRVETVPREVVALAETPGGVDLLLDDGTVSSVHAAVLALGNLPPTTFRELRGAWGYFGSPWPTTELLRRIPRDASVCILGTGLSAVDTALALHRHGHRGPLVSVSRSGLLPRVRSRLRAPVFDPSRAEGIRARLGAAPGVRTVDDVLHALQPETGVGGSDSVRRLRSSLERRPAIDTLRIDVRRAEGQKLPWQEALEAFSESAPEVWRLLPHREKGRFVRELSTLWAIHRHPMPLENGRKLLALLEEGALEVAGGLRGVRRQPVGPRYRVTVGRTRPREIEADFLVNATGAGTDVSRADLPLLRDALASGTVSAHPFGGLRVGFSSLRVIAGDGRPSSRLFGLGPVTRGTHFVTNSVFQNSRMAGRLARDLAGWAASAPRALPRLAIAAGAGR